MKFRVRVDGNEKVGRFLVGDGGSSFEGYEGVVLAGVNDLGAEPGLQQLTQTAADVEHQIFFFEAIGADGAGIVASVARVDDDFSDLEAQGAGERTVAAGGGLGFADIQISGWGFALAPGGGAPGVVRGWRRARNLADARGLDLW